MKGQGALGKLLNGLKAQDDEDVALGVFEGRAISRSDENLHMITDTGIIAVPIDKISRVIPMHGVEHMVRVVVRNPEGVKQLFRVPPSPCEAPPPAGGPVALGQVGPGQFLGTIRRRVDDTVLVCNYFDTATVTGEEGADASDDNFINCARG